MSSFAKILGLKKEKTETASTAIAKLRKIEEMFVKKQEYLEQKIKEEMATARANGRDNRRIALQALRKKKRYEQQLQQIDGTLTTIEMQREALESSATNTSILSTMKLAADALKTAHHKMKVDDVHNIIDDITEQQMVAKELADAISSTIGNSDGLDDEDLLKELEDLDQQELDKRLLSTVPPPLPAVPLAPLPCTSRPSAVTQEMDEDLKKLEDWAS